MAPNNEILDYVKEFEDQISYVGGQQIVEQARSLLYIILRTWTLEDDIMIWINDLTGGLMPLSQTPGSLIFVNGKVLDYFNYTEEEWLNSEYDETLVHEDDLEITTEHINARSQLLFSIRMRKKGEGSETNGQLMQQRHLWFNLDGHEMRITIGEKI